jgi:WD40 repeat protein
VSAVSYSPDDRHIAAGGADEKIIEWDAQSAEEITVLLNWDTWHEYVKKIAYTRDCRQLVCQICEYEILIFDLESGVCKEKIPGIGDVAAIAGGPSLFPFLVLSHFSEVTIYNSITNEESAWSPYALDKIITHQDGRSWAGLNGNQMILFAIEGYIKN